MIFRLRAFQISPENEMIFQKSAFLVSEMGVSLSLYLTNKISIGLFDREGFILQKLSGEGTVFVEFDGHVVEY